MDSGQVVIFPKSSLSEILGCGSEITGSIFR